MATVTGLTAARMQEIIDATIVSAHITAGDLILVLHDTSTINAGHVTGAVGPSGGAFTICTSGTRPGSPTDGLAIYETDTKLVRIWNSATASWKCQPRVICTSGTRPAGLGVGDEGVKIYETNTNLEYIWSGTGWVGSTNLYYDFADVAARTAAIPAPTEGQSSYRNDVDAFEIYAGTAWRPPWNIGWGVVGTPGVKATLQTGIGTGLVNVSGLSTTFTAVPNRRYRLHGALWTVTGTSAGFCTVSFFEGVNQIQATYPSPVVVAGATGLPAFWNTYLTGLSAGAHTYQVVVAFTTNANNQAGGQSGSTGPAFIYAEDIGPIGSPT